MRAKSVKSVIALVAVSTLGIAVVSGMAFAGPKQGNFPPASPQMRGGPDYFCGCGQGGPRGPMGWQLQSGPKGPGVPPAPCQGFNGFDDPRGPNDRGFGHRGFARGQSQWCDRFSPDAQDMRARPDMWDMRQDMPPEIRNKAVEAAKLRIDLDNVLSQTPLDRAKAIELNGQIGKLNQDIRAWRFEQKLNHIEAAGATSQPVNESANDTDSGEQISQ